MSDKKEKQFSRRDFLKTTGAATGGIIGGSLIGGFIGSGWASNDNEIVGSSEDTSGGDNASSNDNFAEARMFFSRQEDFDVLVAATETIFPEDDNGPGAIALGVPFFIDRQLAGNWGSNARDYMQGPFAEGEDTQGYQSPLTRGEIFLQGIRRIIDESVERFDHAFVELGEDARVEIIAAFEAGEIEMQGVSSSRFFQLLKQATLEGAYCDPLYGGNKNMDGWKMKGYPGSVMSYYNVIDQEEFEEMDQVALKDHMNSH
ncbi:gluconate 2-dehydrogenase subunit 3 family protein [Salinicoccus halitifaciens]|uniref:Gluconate 2-dehydrogenase gamma chain n=1 Tax=Salinicoccus halitifaciens TaxID=1073415 RepID=A0ABV2EB36_9STAP|nr:gluconate 2-dehydrogenase subunit 3 family protein [Salinicoccus halitifaciens]MCD2137570.1 gluconate 2-dehydrogenase subunit 3 family protein [Salinicoccus halitifaciens]